MQAVSAVYLFCTRFGPMLPPCYPWRCVSTVALVRCSFRCWISWHPRTIRHHCWSSPTACLSLWSSAFLRSAASSRIPGFRAVQQSSVTAAAFALLACLISHGCWLICCERKILLVCWKIQIISQANRTSRCALLREVALQLSAAATSFKTDLFCSDVSAWFLFGRMSFLATVNYYFR